MTTRTRYTAPQCRYWDSEPVDEPQGDWRCGDCPECDQQAPPTRADLIEHLRADLLTDAANLLDQADSNTRAGRTANAAWCRSVAFGVLRARKRLGTWT